MKGDEELLESWRKCIECGRPHAPSIYVRPRLCDPCSEAAARQSQAQGDRDEQMRQSEKRRWRQKLTPVNAVSGPSGAMLMPLDGWDLHELYTRLVEPQGEEGCCAGCTILPPGWCSLCDKTRKAPKEGT
jgi:hypothetical protein